MATQNNMDLTQGKPFSVLLKFAIPVILGNLFQLFYTLADSVIVGKTMGAGALAAVGSTSIIIYLVLCFIQGFTSGFGICLGQRFGAKDEDGMRRSAGISWLLSLFFTIVLTLAGCLLAHPILYWMQTPQDIYDDAYTYLFLILLGTGATIFYNIVSNLLRALGDSKTPLKFLAFSAVLNAVLDFVLIGGLGFGIVCSAVTTVAAEAASAVMAAVYMACRVPELCPERGQWRIRRALLGPILRYGSVTALQQAVQPICKVLIQGQVNALGVGSIAAFNAVTRVDDFAFTPEQSIATAITTYIAQNRGARQPERIRRGGHSAV